MTFPKLRTFCGLLLVLLSSNAFSALPPKTEEMLKQMSTLIVTGTVKDIRTKDVQEGDFVKTYYYIDVAIKQIEKGTIDNKDKPIEAIGWVNKKTPAGWVGPSGVNGLDDLKKKTEVRLFLSGNKIIEPNGLLILQDQRKQP